MASGTMRCTIVVPTYNTAALAAQCLRVLFSDLAGRPDTEVVVSDDGSDDDTPAVLEQLGRAVQVVRSAVNRGFAHACNAGAQVASGELLVFYNTDLTPHPGWLDALLEYAASGSRPALVGTRLLFPDGRLQHCGAEICADGFPRHVYAGFPGDHEVAMRSGAARIVTAACVLVRAAAFADLGGFDTGYRNGYEDVDLCLRARQAGYEVHYCHRSVLTHLVSATREPRRAEFARSEQRFLDRWRKLPATDFARYCADGLLRADYGPTYPLRLTVSPELAELGQSDAAEEDLRAVVHDLRRENVRLRLRLGDAAEDSVRPDAPTGPGPDQP